MNKAVRQKQKNTPKNTCFNGGKKSNKPFDCNYIWLHKQKENCV